MQIRVSKAEAQAIIDGLKLQASNVYDYGGKLPDGTEVADHDGSVEAKFEELIKKFAPGAFNRQHLITEVWAVSNFYQMQPEDVYKSYADGHVGLTEKSEEDKTALLARFTKEFPVELPCDQNMFEVCRAMARFECDTDKFESIEGDFELITVYCLESFLQKYQRLESDAYAANGNKPVEKVTVSMTATERNCLIQAARYCSGEDFGFDEHGWASIVKRNEVKPLAKQLEALLVDAIPPEGCESIFLNTVC